MTDKHVSGKILHSNGNVTDFITQSSTPTLRELQKAVGGYIEPVRMMQHVPYFKDDPVMIVNEMGHIDGLPFNEEATLLVQRSIVGDVIIMPRRLLK